MLVTYDEIMEWYNQRKTAGLTIEPPTMLEQYKAATTKAPMAATPPCDTCRWHISGLWGSEYCAGHRHCHDCPEWAMFRHDDYIDPGDNDPWRNWRKE